MAEFLTTRGVSLHIENIIKTAKNRLVLISPFVRIPENLFQNLKDADRQKVKITLVYGKDKLNPDEKDKLAQLNNLSIYFLENLHAKCFFNEEFMVITSMNLYDFSEQKNREMGVLISAKDDKSVFSKAVEEARLIVSSSKETDLRVVKSKSYPLPKKQKGYCIKCGKVIRYNLEKPFCRKCFSEWDEWGNPYHEESCCHTCGKPAPTTMATPRCNSCYYKSA